LLQIGERERVQAAEDALARRRKVVAKLEAQANCQAQQQRAFARVSLRPLPSLYIRTLAESCSQAILKLDLHVLSLEPVDRCGNMAVLSACWVLSKA